jgi:hypothetical protein
MNRRRGRTPSQCIKQRWLPEGGHFFEQRRVSDRNVQNAAAHLA